MSLPRLTRCPGTLAEGFATYSPACRRRLFEGRAVSHVLELSSPRSSETGKQAFLEAVTRVSISGAQDKLSLLQDGRRLRIPGPDEHGTHILKPIPGSLLKRVEEVPANEHLTMQIAAQVYGLETAPNALIFFAEGEPAYITRRFDVRSRDPWLKRDQEDFGALAGKTTYSSDEKYDSSYEEAGMLIRQYVPAWRVEIEKYFARVVFNFLFSNGDAHLKNFSLLKSAAGDYRISPAYDLINTFLHVDDTPFALRRGLFADGFKSAIWKNKGHPGSTDFIEFANRIGVQEKRIVKLLNPFQTRQLLVNELIDRSFLSETAKRAYALHYNTRRNQLNT